MYSKNITRHKLRAVRFTSDIDEAIQKIAEQEERSISQIIFRLVRLGLENYQPQEDTAQ